LGYIVQKYSMMHYMTFMTTDKCEALVQACHRLTS